MSFSFDCPHRIGSRHDPHAQTREARQQELLLHSMSVYRELFELVFEHRRITTTVEIGVESGRGSAMYAELGASDVYCVEPEPSDELRSYMGEQDALHLVERPSPEALDTIPIADLYIVDGDHNYAVVRRELDWILNNAPDAVIVLHDVLWPCARRDLYYEPSSVRPAERHPASADGPTVWHDELTPAGLVGLGAFRTAKHAGGERNGVITAVEDALEQAPDDRWHCVLVPAVFGLGLLVRRTDTSAENLVEALRPYGRSRLLAAMENNRIALYTRVLQLQYEAAGRAVDADRLAEEIARASNEKQNLATALDEAVAESEALRRQNRLLRQQLDDLANRTVANRIRARFRGTSPGRFAISAEDSPS
ncbi:class I SAM-dependent methyltransferase [Saccharopolyspora taberi]|uniref:Class I SAM-dependent methyltransferase n=1 Tax=Saccharopolyspora taberi TaxID=60895 RepID=A0ABN3VB57_9PSEU